MTPHTSARFMTPSDIERGEKRAHLDHTYAGTAYPVEWGGRVHLDEPVRIAGAFHAEDFQDGMGVLLTNGEQHPLMGWVVPRCDIPKVRYAFSKEGVS